VHSAGVSGTTPAPGREDGVKSAPDFTKPSASSNPSGTDEPANTAQVSRILLLHNIFTIMVMLPSQRLGHQSRLTVEHPNPVSINIPPLVFVWS